jgi:hypothetical protein
MATQINNQKCKIMHVGHNNQKHVYQLHQNIQDNDSNNKNLIVINVEKDLGTNNLTWDNHINYGIDKEKKKLGLIKNCLSYLNENPLNYYILDWLDHF